MENLLSEIRKCLACKQFLVDGINPIVAASQSSKIAIIGQAPGRVVHQSGIPWDDKSGYRLREWLNIDKEQFYNDKIFAIIPMGFCFPGTGKSGDLPPRKECAPLWHEKLFQKMPELELIILIGGYAQNYYLGKDKRKTLTETVRNYDAYLPKFFPLPHPSPRNNIWLAKNEWFLLEVIPELQMTISKVCNK